MAPEISHNVSISTDFILLSYLPILKVFCVWLEWLKCLNFDGPNWGKVILVPQSLLNFIFSSYLPTLNFEVSCLNNKKFELWRPGLRGTPHYGTPKVCQMLFFLHICLFWKFPQFIVSGWASLIKVDPFILISPNFVKFYLLFIFTNSENFTCLAWIVRVWFLLCPNFSFVCPNFSIVHQVILEL